MYNVFSLEKKEQLILKMWGEGSVSTGTVPMLKNLLRHPWLNVFFFLIPFSIRKREFKLIKIGFLLLWFEINQFGKNVFITLVLKLTRMSEKEFQEYCKKSL